MIARNKEITDVLPCRLISSLRKSENGMDWLPVSLTETGPYRIVYSFLTNILGIEVVRPEDLRVFFNENQEFLHEQNNDWLVRLYKIYETVSNVFLFSNPRNILDACIVKTATGRFVAPYRKTDNGYLPLVFLPPRHGNNYGVEIVDPYLYNRCRGFFENVLHLKQPDEYELIKESVAKKYKDPSKIIAQEHFADVQKIVKYLKNPDMAEDLKTCLRKHFYIRCKQDRTTIWLHPFVETFLFPEAANGLKIDAYFEELPGYKENKYLDYEYYQSAGFSWDDMRLFDVTDNLMIGLDETWGDYNVGGSSSKAEWRTNGDFRWKLSIEQVEAALLYISNNPKAKTSIIKSQTIWKLLLENELKLIGNVMISRSSSPDLYDEPAEIIHLLKRDRYNYLLKDWNGKWLYTKSMDLVSQDKITRRELNDSIYGRMSLDSNLYNILGFRKGKEDQLVEVEKELDKVPAERRKMYLEIELYRQFGLSVEQLKQLKKDSSKGFSGSVSSYEEDTFEFPVENVKNWEALKKHVAQILVYANPVRYESLVRRVRISKPEDDIAAYLKNMYRDGASYRFACQLCHRPFQSVTICQLENKPEKELDPMNLCLCPNCARKFQMFRNSSSDAKRLLDKIAGMTEDDIRRNDYVSVTIKDLDIWFTQTHIAEIVELLKVRQQAEEEEEYNSGKIRVAGAPLPTKRTEPLESVPAQECPAAIVMTQASEKKVQRQPVTVQIDETQTPDFYMKAVGKRVYHLGMKKYAIITSCDGKYIVLQLEKSGGQTQEKSYDLAMCIRNKWLVFDKE